MRNNAVADLGGAPSGTPPAHGPKFSQFHAVFRKIWQNHMLVPPWRVGAPPTGNPGSAPAMDRGHTFLTSWSRQCHRPRHRGCYSLYLWLHVRWSVLIPIPTFCQPNHFTLSCIFWFSDTSWATSSSSSSTRLFATRPDIQEISSNVTSTNPWRLELSWRKSKNICKSSGESRISQGMPIRKGRQPIICPNISENYMKMKKIGSGARPKFY